DKSRGRDSFRPICGARPTVDQLADFGPSTTMTRYGLLLLLVVLSAGGLAGCESRPRPPLYSSAQATGSFGYFEEQLGSDRLRVGYRAPLRRDSTTSQAERRREADRLVNLSYDLAL